jgi:hypothetical protein
MSTPEGLTLVLCGEIPDEAECLILEGALADVHMWQANPHLAQLLTDTFRGLPFFFLSHFLHLGDNALDSLVSGKPLSIVPLHSKSTRALPLYSKSTGALTFQNFCQVTVKTLPERRPWDGQRTVRDAVQLVSAAPALVGMHVRTTSNVPYLHFDLPAALQRRR